MSRISDRKWAAKDRAAQERADARSPEAIARDKARQAERQTAARAGQNTVPEPFEKLNANVAATQKAYAAAPASAKERLVEARKAARNATEKAVQTGKSARGFGGEGEGNQPATRSQARDAHLQAHEAQMAAAGAAHAAGLHALARGHEKIAAEHMSNALEHEENREPGEGSDWDESKHPRDEQGRFA